MLQNFTLGAFSQGVSGGGGAFESIASATGTGSNASITFSAIPITYQHLQIRFVAKNTTAASDASFAQMAINGSTTASNYAYHELYGNGTTVSASGASNTIPYYGTVVRNNATSIVGVGIIDIHNYASTTQNKTIRIFTGNDRNGSGDLLLWSGLYNSTSAITSLTFYANLTSSTTTYFTTATEFALYGIKGA